MKRTFLINIQDDSKKHYEKTKSQLFSLLIGITLFHEMFNDFYGVFI